jgi:hypothetical protein
MSTAGLVDLIFPLAGELAAEEIVGRRSDTGVRDVAVSGKSGEITSGNRCLSGAGNYAHFPAVLADAFLVLGVFFNLRWPAHFPACWGKLGESAEPDLSRIFGECRTILCPFSVTWLDFWEFFEKSSGLLW